MSDKRFKVQHDPTVSKWGVLDTVTDHFVDHSPRITPMLRLARKLNGSE